MADKEEKPDANIQPAHGAASGPDTPFDVSVSGRHVIDTASGEVAENPLTISDRVKADNVAIIFRLGGLFVATTLVFAMFGASCYAQLVCMPPKQWTPPIELVAFVVAIYAGTSANVVNRLLGFWRKDG